MFGIDCRLKIDRKQCLRFVGKIREDLLQGKTLCNCSGSFNTICQVCFQFYSYKKGRNNR